MTTYAAESRIILLLPYKRFTFIIDDSTQVPSVKTKFDTVPDSLSPYGLFYAIILCLLKISYLSAFFDDLDYVWEELWFVAQTMHLLHLKPKQKS